VKIPGGGTEIGGFKNLGWNNQVVGCMRKLEGEPTPDACRFVPLPSSECPERSVIRSLTFCRKVVNPKDGDLCEATGNGMFKTDVKNTNDVDNCFGFDVFKYTCATSSQKALEPCVCSTTWTDSESGGTCGEEQVGCPTTSCDGEPRWCLTANDGTCATDLGGWTLCDDSTPVFGKNTQIQAQTFSEMFSSSKFSLQFVLASIGALGLMYEAFKLFQKNEYTPVTNPEEI